MSYSKKFKGDKGREYLTSLGIEVPPPPPLKTREELSKHYDHTVCHGCSASIPKMQAISIKKSSGGSTLINIVEGEGVFQNRYSNSITVLCPRCYTFSKDL